MGSQFQQVARALGAGPCDAVVGTPEKQALALKSGYRTAYLRSELRDIPDGTYDIVVDPVGGDATTQGFVCSAVAVAWSEWVMPRRHRMWRSARWHSGWKTKLQLGSTLVPG